MTIYTATFHPQAWDGDDTIDVAGHGPRSWDATAAVAGLDADYRAQLLYDIAAGGEAVDESDALLADPAAPDWVSGWAGPFTITVTDGA